MIKSTSLFQNSERASYELALMLRDLPAQLHGAPLNAELLEQVEAADRHATNSTTILLDGLQSLGRVMYSAGVNKEVPSDAGDCARVGAMITEIALHLEFMNDFREEVAEHKLHIAVSSARKGAKS
jgi:hypothetical protein